VSQGRNETRTGSAQNVAVVSKVRTEDFEAAGLLDGLEGTDRAARLTLLQELIDDGFSMEDLLHAAREGRLGLLPVERELTGEPRYTPREVAEAAGMPVDFVLSMREAIGLARPDPDERTFDERDLETVRTFARLREAGVPEEGMLEVSGVLGRSLAQVTEAMRVVFTRALLEQGVDERELSARNAAAARELLPLITPLMDHTLRLHFRDQVRNQQFGGLELSEPTSPGMRQVFVGFTDMVGFTRIGERTEITEVAKLLERLSELARLAVRPPNRIVKTIGDAIMFVSPTPEPLLDTSLSLTEQVEAEGPDFPSIRSGLAGGVALSREGDWYGPPVNLASRITDIARAGSVLATRDLRDAAPDRYAWSYAGEHKLRGVRQPVPLYRVRRLEQPPTG
jgi:adenylate cyclase